MREKLLVLASLPVRLIRFSKLYREQKFPLVLAQGHFLIKKIYSRQMQLRMRCFHVQYLHVRLGNC